MSTAPKPSKQSAIRMAPDTWERAERLTRWLSGRRAAASTRADVLREAISRGLRAMEKERDRDATDEE